MAKQKAADMSQIEAELRFMGTYGDAITLLMCFFVLLYAMSNVDIQKFQLLVSGLADPFKNTAIEDGLLETGPGIVGSGFTDPSPGSSIEAVTLIERISGPPGDSDEPIEDPAEEPDDKTYVESAEELRKVQEALVAALTEYGMETSVTTRIDTRGLVVSIATDDVLFSSGSPNLSDRGRDIIGALVPTLEGFSNQLLVEGHTDAVPIDQNGYTNWNLSADRALAVLGILDGSDINPTRLSATGYGEFRPLGDNVTEEGRAANRRVELVIVAGKPPTTEN